MSRAQRLRAVWLLLFLLVCFAISSYYFNLAGTHLIPRSEPYRLQAAVPTAVSLANAADVREAGVNIGRVAAQRGRGDSTILELELDDEHAPVYRDAQVLIRAKSVAGENYVEVERGTPKAGALPSGGVLGIDRAKEATQIDELFSVFDEVRRRDLQRALGGLSRGLDRGGGDLNRTLEAAAAVPGEGAPAVRVLSRERDHVAGLVDSFGRVTRALGERGDSIRLLTRQAKATAEAVAARDQKLRETIAVLPPFLRQARVTSTRLNGFSRTATPVLRDLRLATTDLVPTVRDLLPAARGGQTVARELRGFARAATPALAQLRPFARVARPFVAPLEAFLRQANPFFAYMAPYWREVSTFFALDAASYQPTDALGHVARIALPVSRSNLSGVLTPEQDKALQALSGELDTRGNNAYPAPGEAGDPKPFTGTYPRVEADSPYTR
jgi:phospholipid/cholesterol/gamma-HCH transport system substrate-binding protein